jgi:16S rRNA processing protein RimM
VAPTRAELAVARILRARGRIGEVAAEILTDFPERLLALRDVFLARPSDDPAAARPARLRRVWLHKGQAIFHFEGCDSISEAEKLRGLEVRLPLSERLPLPPGKYFVTDLEGCEVFEAGARIGCVRGVQFTGEAVAGTPLLVVETGSGELLIPLAEEFCTRIDIAARRIDVRLPKGLRELSGEHP